MEIYQSPTADGGHHFDIASSWGGDPLSLTTLFSSGFFSQRSLKGRDSMRMWVEEAEIFRSVYTDKFMMVT